MSCVCEQDAPAYLLEDDVARRWWALPRDVLLPLSDGTGCRLLFAGRPGGAMGPDVRDAVLRFLPGSKPRSSTPYTGAAGRDATNVVGDVEFHIRSSDWFAHAHQSDPRYNNVILHVVLICDDTRPVLRQDGSVIPTCSLYDLPRTTHAPAGWPCHVVMQSMSDEERTRLLRFAGLLRFEQKTRAFLALLRDVHPHPQLDPRPQASFSAYDVCLILALAEGLGYGRDRAFFRAAGLRLLGIAGNTPEPLGRAPEPSPLDTSRLRVLRSLVARWRVSGAWKTLRDAIGTGEEFRRGGGGVDEGRGPLWSPVSGRIDGQGNGPQHGRPQGSPPLTAPPPPLRAIFDGLGTARADILICNVVLPFAAAVGLVEDDALLGEQAEKLYVTYPALSSNQVTRAMCRQLRLSSEPESACQQQGLHYIYAQTCREKRCGQCIAGKQGWMG